MNRILAIAALAAAGLVACGPPPPPALAPGLGLDLERMSRTPSGVWYDDMVVGSGAAAVDGSTVTIHYTGWFADGTLFDSSRARDEPISAPIGRMGPFIEGWNDGIRGMREGGRRILVIPPRLAYGPGGVPGTIPPNATLVYDVELIRVGR